VLTSYGSQTITEEGVAGTVTSWFSFIIDHDHYHDTLTMTDAAKPERPTAARLPSLNQLAARINVAPNPNAPNARPRLAAALLRTGSTASLSTNASAADSVAVNAPSTRAASPAPSTGSTPSATGAIDRTSTPTPAGGEPLTSENVEQLENQTGTTGPVTTEKKIRGYKNIPSLDAITARLAKTRTLSVDGTAQPPEPELIEHPKTPGLKIKAPEHPLEHTWYVAIHSLFQSLLNIRSGRSITTRKLLILAQLVLKASQAQYTR
jgi:translation initiation factor 4E